MKRMKAAVWHGPDKIRVEEVPIPRIGQDEYLLRVEYCGLCKTDIKKILGNVLKSKGVLNPPRVFGHEMVGTIERINGEIEGLKEGNRVAIFHHVPCLECFSCLSNNYSQCEVYKKIDTTAGVGEPSGGGFAEYIRVPNLIAKRGTVKIPNHISFEEAVFIEPTNCCLKGIKKANIELGNYVAVFGQGPVGLTLNQLAKLRGANVIAIDLTDYRLERAKKEFSADFIINATKENLIDTINSITNNQGVEKSIVAVESPKAVEEAVKCTMVGGDVVFFSEFGEENRGKGNMGMGGLVDMIYSKEINIRGCYSSSYADHQLSADLIFNKKIKTKGLISHTFDLYHLLDAVNLAERRRTSNWEGRKIFNKQEESFKILIKP